MTQDVQQVVETAPNPGSREAGEQGCLCPVMDNWRGAPEIGRIRGFIMRTDCPLHGTAKKPKEEGE